MRYLHNSFIGSVDARLTNYSPRKTDSSLYMLHSVSLQRYYTSCSGLVGDVYALEGDVYDLEGDLCAFEGDVCAFQGDVCAFEDDIYALVGDLP